MGPDDVNEQIALSALAPSWIDEQVKRGDLVVASFLFRPSCELFTTAIVDALAVGTRSLVAVFRSPGLRQHCGSGAGTFSKSDSSSGFLSCFLLRLLHFFSVFAPVFTVFVPPRAFRLLSGKKGALLRTVAIVTMSSDEIWAFTIIIPAILRQIRVLQ